MKIAIYHNLLPGGALDFLINTSVFLKENNQIDLYCHTKNVPKNIFSNTFIFPIKKTKNIFSNLIQVVFELKKINKIIAKKISKRKYDLVIIYPCMLTQSPYLIRYLSRNNSVYIFTEPKREFYEKTSFDYNSFKKTITRLIRCPIKYIDILNCKKAEHIITNSIYSKDVLKKNYNKNSIVIYPGLKRIKDKKIITNNNKKILSVGLLSKTKGHDFSIKQVSGICNQLTILGRNTNETEMIKNIAKRYNVKLKIIHTENNTLKKKIYKNHSIFLANQNMEPFGITTLEATNYNCFVLGKKEGGTPEIITNNKNGILYDNNLELAKNALRSVLIKDKLSIIKTCKIDWKHTANQILQIYHKIKNEPAE